jgi:hypothetical protein
MGERFLLFLFYLFTLFILLHYCFAELIHIIVGLIAFTIQHEQ